MLFVFSFLCRYLIIVYMKWFLKYHANEFDNVCPTMCSIHLRLSIDINYSMGSLLWCLKICVPCHNTWQKESMINWYLDYFSSILEENILNASNRSSYINSYYKAMNLLMLGQEQLWRVHNKILIMYEHISAIH